VSVTVGWVDLGREVGESEVKLGLGDKLVRMRSSWVGGRVVKIDWFVGSDMIPHCWSANGCQRVVGRLDKSLTPNPLFVFLSAVGVEPHCKAQNNPQVVGC
jgi:hypothetical protein